MRIGSKESSSIVAMKRRNDQLHCSETGLSHLPIFLKFYVSSIIVIFLCGKWSGHKRHAKLESRGYAGPAFRPSASEREIWGRGAATSHVMQQKERIHIGM
jgi:hypothetical protein